MVTCYLLYYCQHINLTNVFFESPSASESIQMRLQRKTHDFRELVDIEKNILCDDGDP